jgi:hypothetical protein
LKPTALTLPFQPAPHPTHPLCPVLYYNDNINNFCLLDPEHLLCKTFFGFFLFYLELQGICQKKQEEKFEKMVLMVKNAF